MGCSGTKMKYIEESNGNPLPKITKINETNIENLKNNDDDKIEEPLKDKIASQQILNKENIIFENKHILKEIISVFCFKDGDILIFYKDSSSILYDGNNFKEKLIIKELRIRDYFNYVTEDEFILINDLEISLYKFLNNRTAFNRELIIVNKSSSYENDKLFVLSNKDLLIMFSVFLNPHYSVYQRIEKNNKFKSYDLLDSNQIIDLNDIEDVVNLDDDEFVTIKKLINSDEILLKVFSNKDYLIKRFNTIKCILKSKRMIYFSALPSFKIKNKLLIGGISYLNIIDIYTLELETTIKISENIQDIKILENNCIVLLDFHKILEYSKHILKFYLNKIWFDFESNDIIKKESNEITDMTGEYKTLFKIFNYKNNGLVILVDQNYIQIYKNI